MIFHSQFRQWYVSQICYLQILNSIGFLRTRDVDSSTFITLAQNGSCYVLLPLYSYYCCNERTERKAAREMVTSWRCSSSLIRFVPEPYLRTEVVRWLVNSFTHLGLSKLHGCVQRYGVQWCGLHAYWAYFYQAMVKILHREIYMTETWKNSPRSECYGIEIIVVPGKDTMLTRVHSEKHSALQAFQNSVTNNRRRPWECCEVDSWLSNI